MLVKKRLRINTAVSLITALAVFLLLVFALYRINNAMKGSDLAAQITTGAYERVALRNDYIRTGSERAKVQWFAKHEEIGRLIESASRQFRDVEEARVLAGLRKNHEAIKRIFEKVVENLEKSGSIDGSEAVSRDVEDRLLVQLNTRIYEVAVRGRGLQESAREVLSRTVRMTGGGILLVVILVGTATFLNSWATGRTIADRIGRLRRGAAIIGGGSLDHRIHIAGEDEFSELSASFNAMTSKLAESYGDLQKEIEVRTHAEEELRTAYGRLQTFFDHRIGGIGIVIANAKGGIIQANDYYLTILGHTREEMAVGVIDWRRVTPPEWLPADERALAQLQERGVCDTYEKEYVRRDGTRVPVLITDAMMPGESGHILAFVLDITERKRTEEAIKASLTEKEVLLKEVHHRVKNNLQVISSLVSLQADGSKDETVRQVLTDVTHRVRSMALVHEKLYQSNDLARIDFAEYARSLLGYLWRAHGKTASAIRLTLDLTPVTLPVDIAVPCGLILNELAGNALKHAFPGRAEGEVTVTLKGTADGPVSLSVRDNGLGLPEGFDWQQAHSLGLRLVQMLAGQLGAKVEARDGEGTEFEISFGEEGR